MEKAPSLVLIFMLAMINIMNLLDGRHYVDNNLHKLWTSKVLEAKENEIKPNNTKIEN
jgi:hypothetical protein